MTMTVENATQQTYPWETCVPHLVSRQAAATPHAPALVAGGQSFSYSELDHLANRLARYLCGLGVGPNALVGLCLERSPEMVIGLLGILKAGGAYVPLDPSYPAERLAFMLEDSGAMALVTRRRLAAQLPAHTAHVVCLDDGGVVAAPADAGAALPVADDGAELPRATASDLAYVIYTSGSTGRPKGVQVTHGNLLNLVAWHRRAFAVTPADRATQVASPAFDATGWELWPYLTAGASVYFPDDETRVAPGPLRDWLVAHGVTISFLPTVLAEGVMTLEWPPASALRLLLTGADTLHHHPAPTLPFTLVNNYGPTECTVVATSGIVPPAPHATAPPSIGHPIDNTSVYILDEQGQPVPSGVAGELYVGGAGVARGYLNRPDLTAERFLPDPFATAPGARMYRTGDRARLLPDGQIAFLGRIDDQIKIRGYRIEPGEIVAVLTEHPAVQAATVIAREDEPGDRRIVAYIVPSSAARPSAGDLRDVVMARLPGYMTPAAFVALETLPLTPNGKVDRAALPLPDETNTLADEVLMAPHTPVEERVAGIVAVLLGREQVSVDDDFFMLGGHSLLGTQLIARLADAYGVDVSLRSLFEAPTVRQLSAEIERRLLAALETLSEEDVERLLA